LSPIQIQGEIYKRIYHNLPYLLKSKGTKRGVKALIACFGIPDSMLTVNEFGGSDKFSVSGISELNNSKVYIDTGSAQLSSSLLTPYTSVQYFSNYRTQNSSNIEVGFSPADTINANITGSLGYFNIDQYIGKPSDQYSSSYSSLETLKNNYFGSYTYKHSIWEYIRLIKFYNNSLFKMIKDFVPVRANLSTGIIIKPHILERNKYARHEPKMQYSQYSQSLEIGHISAGPSSYVSASTTTYKNHKTQLGYVGVTGSFGFEKYTGKYQGTTLVITNTTSSGQQLEVSNNASTTVGLLKVPINYLRNNVSMSVRSNRFFDLDYTYNQNKPTNFGLITSSIAAIKIDNYATYKNPNSPYAYIQDYNYYTNHFTIPRYYGSKTISQDYSVYNLGDSSYGNSAAIDKYKYQYAYLLSVYAKPFQMPGRADVQIKYIIDDNQNVLDLTKTNTNIFYTQNIFKSGETINLSLYDYDPSDPNIQYLTNNPNFSLYEGGFTYSPILYNVNSDPTLKYRFITPFVSSSDVNIPGGLSYPALVSGNEASNFRIRSISSGTNTYGVQGMNVEIRRSSGTVTQPTGINVYIYRQGLYGYPDTPVVQVFMANGASVSSVFFIEGGYSPNLTTPPGTDPGYTFTNDDPVVSYVETIPTSLPSVSSTTNTFITGTIDLSPNWWVDSPTRVHLSATQSLYYGKFIQSGSVSSLDTPIFPFELEVGDMIRFYNYTSSWSQNDEYRVLSVDPGNIVSGSNPPGNQYRYFTLDRPINFANTDDYAIPSKISKYIVLKHVPDETNLIVNFPSPTVSTQNSNLITVGSSVFVNQNNSVSSVGNQYGIVFPQYISQSVKDNSGNTIKSLKSQNLI
jgi:hypothetical protein